MNEGATDCKHYKGVRFVAKRKCCGGKVIERTRINCAKRSIVYSDAECIAAVCPFYEVKK